jgi:hypothetical protein
MLGGCLLPSNFQHCLPPSAFCLLLSAYCFLPSAYCLLLSAYCLLHCGTAFSLNLLRTENRGIFHAPRASYH